MTEAILEAKKVPVVSAEGGARTKRGAAQSMVLTLSCPDTIGIVAAVSGFLAARRCLITEAQHHDDTHTKTSFMRTVFLPSGAEPPSMAELDEQFAAEVGKVFAMTWSFQEQSRKCRVLLAVSKHGHCLNSLLHRASTGTLHIDIMGVVSNHQDMRSLRHHD